MLDFSQQRLPLSTLIILGIQLSHVDSATRQEVGRAAEDRGLDAGEGEGEEEAWYRAEAPLTIFLFGNGVFTIFWTRCLSKVGVKSHLSESNRSQKRYQKARIPDISRFATKVRIRFKSE